MDSSGSVQESGWSVEKQFVIDLISSGIPVSSPIGIVQFASDATIRYQLSDDQNRTKILEKVTNLQYTRGWTYMKDAVVAAIYLFEHQSHAPQRRLVLITDGDPRPVDQTPCDLISKLDELGVDVMIIGVGVSWTRARIDCLVKRPEDIIEVVNFTNAAFGRDRNVTDDFLCRDVSFLLTEIKPSLGNMADTINPYHPVPFVEFYNDVKDMDLSLYNFKITGTFDGDISASNIVRSAYGNNWPYGTYLVIYDNAHIALPDTAWCYDCVCTLLPPTNHFCNQSIYISIPNSYDTLRSSITNWNVIIYDATDIIQRQVMDISYGMTAASDWTLIDDGFTYELRDRSCDPRNGQCWKQSCTIYGTPGHLPIECEATCSDHNCQTGGDLNGTCNITTGLCNCNDHCHNIHDLPTCNCVVPPINCSIILNSDVDHTGLPGGDASWNKPAIDWSNLYTVWYQVKWYTFQNDEHHLKIQATPVNQRGFTLLNMEYRYPNVYKQEVRAMVAFDDDASISYSSEWTVCKLLTMEPTSSPTPAPTLGLPPIDACTVTIRPGTHRLITIDVQWTAANVSASDTFNREQFNDAYKLYFTEMDNVDVRAWKVHNRTFYAESLPYNYNATQLVYGNKLQIKVSVVIHERNDSTLDLDRDPWFDALMYAQATVCEWFSSAPTALPTHSPSTPPSEHPSIHPTLIPTSSPTYTWWVLQGCVITVVNNNNNGGSDWHIAWIESDPSSHPLSLPEHRKIYMYVNGVNKRILNQNQFSPQIIPNVILQVTNISAAEIELKAQQLVGGSGQIWQFSPHTAVCDIITASPTEYPTISPTIPSPTTAPLVVPTANPSQTPTVSPTYYLPIEWCIVLIKGDELYNITFKIPHYETNGNTPAIHDVKYMINYAEAYNGRYELRAQDVGTVHATYNEEISTNGIGISYETHFKMSTVNRYDTEIMYAEWTQCDIRTLSPTVHPTLSPTLRPTMSPSNPEIGVFVYSDDATVCSGDERCACVVDKDNYQCIGSDYPQGTQIEHTQLLFLPSYGVQMNVLLLGRYPYYLAYDVEIEWRFVYLNDTVGSHFNFQQRIKPIRGSTTIAAGERLGEVVLAEFVPMPHGQNVYNPQWYKFIITKCEAKGNNNDYVSCGLIYPSWAYVLWVPSQAIEALLIGGGEPWADWIFYLLLSASVAGVVVAYVMFVFFKNRNLKNNEINQDRAIGMLKGIAPSAHVQFIANPDD